jgi:hypothetical protein
MKTEMATADESDLVRDLAAFYLCFDDESERKKKERVRRSRQSGVLSLRRSVLIGRMKRQWSAAAVYRRENRRTLIHG